MDLKKSKKQLSILMCGTLLFTILLPVVSVYAEDSPSISNNNLDSTSTNTLTDDTKKETSQSLSKQTETDTSSKNKVNSTSEQTIDNSSSLEVNLIVHYQDEAGNKISEDKIISGTVGTSYDISNAEYQPEIKGYTFKEIKDSKSGIFSDNGQTVTYTYTKNKDVQLKTIVGDFNSSSVTQYDMNQTIFDSIGKYQFNAIGNSNTVGFDSATSTIPHTTYIDADNDPTTFSSTSMVYHKKGTQLVKAYLYIADSKDESTNLDRSQAYIEGPNGGKFVFDDGPKNVYYDVTSFISDQGEGEYWAKNLTSSRVVPKSWDSNADWSIVFIEQNNTLPYRQTQFSSTSASSSIAPSQSVGNPNLPAAENATGEYLVIVTGGNTNLKGDYLNLKSYDGSNLLSSSNLSENTRPVDNFFLGSISYYGEEIKDRAPYRVPTNSDITVNKLNVPNGTNNIKLTESSAGDGYGVTGVGVLIDLALPKVNIQSTENISGYIGQEAEVETTVKNNTGNAFLNNGLIEVKLPDSVKLTGLSSLDLTNFEGEAEYDEASNIVRIKSSTPFKAGIDYSFKYKVKFMKVSSGSKIETAISGDTLYPSGQKFEGQTITESSNDTIVDVKKTGNITVKYEDIEGNLLNLDGDSQNPLVLEGEYASSYNTQQKAITGYTFKELQGNPTGTFSDQDQTVTYIYTRNQGTADVTYIDDTTKKVLSVKDLTGYTGEKAGYTTADIIKSYEEQGYVLVSDNYPKDDVTFTDNIQHYEVHLSHKVNTVTENKAINEIIHYVYSDGTKASEDYKATPLEFTRTVSIDVVTGEVTYGDWTSEQSFKSVNSPKIDGYTPDKAQIEEQVVRYDSKDLDFTVTYSKTPTTPTTPNNTDSTLPMTGETRSGLAIVIGLAILSIIGLVLTKLRFSKKAK